jgi:hypothetical protein
MMQVAAEYALPKVVCFMRFQIFVWTLLTTETQRHRENESCVSFCIVIDFLCDSVPLW